MIKWKERRKMLWGVKKRKNSIKKNLVKIFTLWDGFILLILLLWPYLYKLHLDPLNLWFFMRTIQCFVLTLWSLWKWSPLPSLKNWFDYFLSFPTASCLPWDSLPYKWNMKAYSFYSDRAKAFSVIICVVHGEISEWGLILAKR